MTPKARDLQEPGQHDMIQALRDALRQDNSEELNPRMREALKGFRENLQFHPYVRWIEKRATIARTAGSQLFAFTRVRVVAGLVAIAGISIAGVLLITARPPDLFAAVLEAMAEVKTAHIVTTKGDTDLEAWFSREHGVRSESANYIEILTWEAGWVYDRRAHKVTVRGAHPDAINECFMSLSGASWLARDDGRRVQVSDVVLGGAPAKRIDIEYSGFDRQYSRHAKTIWIDPATMRVTIMEIRSLNDERRIVVDRFHIDYDMPVDPALFTFEPPEGATVVDPRTDSKPAETAENTPIEKSGDVTEVAVDYVRERKKETAAQNGD